MPNLGMPAIRRLSKTVQILDPHLSVFLKPEMIDIGAHSRIDGLVKLEGGQGLDIGEFVHVASFCHLNAGGGRLVIEDHCSLSSHVLIGSATPDWNYLYVSASEPSNHRHTKYYVTRICTYAALFMGAIIVPGVTVGEGAIVRPGAVVMEDVRPWTIVAGNPAVAVGRRRIRVGSFESNHSLQLSQFIPLYP